MVWADRILFLQFVPSVIRFITIPALAAIGFIAILVLTALFGRVYCSAICPLGILQDVFARISKKIAPDQTIQVSKRRWTTCVIHCWA